MTMTAGTVSVSNGGVVSGTGFARQVFDYLVAHTDFAGAPSAGLTQAKKQLAVIANAAAALITYVKANAVVNTTNTNNGTPVKWTGTGTGTVG